jgi:hypothetical protein
VIQAPPISASGLDLSTQQQHASAATHNPDLEARMAFRARRIHLRFAEGREA